MNLFSKDNLSKIFNALIVTFAFAAMCHLLLVFAVSVIKRDISYINPLDFLGVSILLPQYRESAAVAAAGWLTLIALFFMVLYIRHHYHIYVAIVSESWFMREIQKTKKRVKTAADALLFSRIVK